MCEDITNTIVCKDHYKKFPLVLIVDFEINIFQIFNDFIFTAMPHLQFYSHGKYCGQINMPIYDLRT